MYPKVVLSLCHLPNFSEVTVEHDVYDDGSDVEKGEILAKVVPQVPVEVESTIEPLFQSTCET